MRVLEVALAATSARRRRTTGDNEFRPLCADWFDRGFFLVLPRCLGGGEVGSGNGRGGGDDSEVSESVESES